MKIRKDERKLVLDFIEIIENEELEKKALNYNKLAECLKKLLKHYDESRMISKNLNVFLNYTRREDKEC